MKGLQMNASSEPMAGAVGMTTAYGINPQASLMHPFDKELSETLTVCHGVTAVIFDYREE